MFPSQAVLRALVLALAILPALSGAPAFARGAGESQAARSERTQGTVALNLGRYDEAVEHLARAYSLTQDPEILFSLAQAYRLGGKADKALAIYSAFLRVAGARPKYRAQVERAAAEIESITSFVLTQPVDSRSSGKAAAPAPEPSAPAEAVAKIEPPPEGDATKPTQESKEGSVIAAAPAPALTPKPEPAPAPALALTAKPAAAPPPSRPVYKRWWFWTGVAALAAGGAATWWYAQPNQQTPGSTYGAVRVLP